jgi:D-alanyl-D-alanine carboxypeptidase
MRSLAAAVVLVASLARGAHAQTDPRLSARVDQYLRPLVASGDFNGVALVARGGRVLVQRAYGKADWDLDAPLSARSRFRVASITKTFTAAAVAMLAEQGKLSVRDPLSKFVPDFPSGEKIQIRHLLLFAAGVPNPSASGCSAATLDDLVADLARKPLDFEPGTRSQYSNGSYVLLARVIEAASGTPWATFLHDRIFAPLRLDATTVDDPGRVVPDRARGFVPGVGPAGVEHAPCEGAWADVGSGSVVSSATDLYRWGRAVRAESLFKRTALEYPYGWGVRKYFDRSVIEQSGIVDGFSSYLAVYLDADLYVVLLTNVQSGTLTELGKALAALALGRPAPTVTPSPPSVAWTAAERARWVGRFRNERIATVTLSERGEGVRLRWADSPETLFLSATGPSAAYDRQDGIALTLSADGAAISMRWANGDVQDFRRIP